MSNPRKIKIIKRRTGAVPPAAQPPVSYEMSVTSGKKSEREMTRQVKIWIADWRDQRQRRMNESLAIFYPKRLTAN